MKKEVHPEYWDRDARKLIQRENYAGQALSWMYSSPIGKLFLYGYFATRLHSWVYRQYKRSPLTKNQALQDIEKYQIDLNEFDIEESDIGSYRDFFLRKFNQGARPFNDDKDTFSAFAEGFYLGYKNTHEDIRFPVKGGYLSAEQILENDEISKRFMGGPVLVCRLSPIDYHWFHFPFDGQLTDAYHRKGKVHAVNLVALRHKQDIFCTNERQVNLLYSEDFGHLAYVEVGAMGVGRIHQTFNAPSFQRGQEKGYFDFGASTIIVFGEKGRWEPSADIIEHTANERETKVKLGQAVAHRSRN
ncbi:phosphatidylserine decarboxylase [Paraneptunicella aestuarii]|uniref:phosphatidylserine decarboxylase n=1 Tax=Paraneptunicella aestuarii TaxID=2831148 RepID=UPI001E60311B|nr:phosphatidylserine decarboxylase [Paraneptunicella aestuarii]UAA37496.1 phosphatidylserine decarboxylase [Paraneptunicella aestuarii]